MKRGNHHLEARKVMIPPDSLAGGCCSPCPFHQEGSPGVLLGCAFITSLGAGWKRFRVEKWFMYSGRRGICY